MNETVKIYPLYPEVEDMVTVEITLGNQCNFECAYCPAILHDGSHGWLNYDDLIKFLNNVLDVYHDKKILVQFTGGEPTMYPKIRKLLQFCQAHNMVICVITNGTRTNRWWSEHASYFDRVAFTYHYPQVEEFQETFIENVRIANQVAQTHINFTVTPEEFDYIFTLSQKFKHLYDVNVRLKALRYDFGSKFYPYTEAQTAIIKDFSTARRPSHKDVARRNRDLRGITIKEDPTGKRETIMAAQIALNQENQWKGWKCWTGIQKLFVNFDGQIYRGVCKVGGSIGHISEDLFLPTEPVICTKQFCNCPTDMYARKERL